VAGFGFVAKSLLVICRGYLVRLIHKYFIISAVERGQLNNSAINQ
jgi:hypothetical protein